MESVTKKIIYKNKVVHKIKIQNMNTTFNCTFKVRFEHDLSTGKHKFSFYWITWYF